MLNKKEIEHLFQLLDDPDTEVYDSVNKQLCRCGVEIIPSLEHWAECSTISLVHERVEEIIHEIHFQNLKNELITWTDCSNPELLHGAFILSKYHNPLLDVPSLLKQIESIRKSLWLELNHYLTPIEKISIFFGIFYNQYKFCALNNDKNLPEYFSMEYLLHTKKGNFYTLSILMLSLAKLLDIPLQLLQLPNDLLLIYEEELQAFNQSHKTVKRIAFYLNPIEGIVYPKEQIDLHLKSVGYGPLEKNYEMRCLDSMDILNIVIKEMSLCYEPVTQYNHICELQSLRAILENKQSK